MEVNKVRTFDEAFEAKDCLDCERDCEDCSRNGNCIKDLEKMISVIDSYVAGGNNCEGIDNLIPSKGCT